MNLSKPSDLVSFTLTGFPLAKQQESLVELLKSAAFSDMEITHLVVAVQGKSVQEAREVVTEICRRKNAALKAALGFSM